MIGWLSKAMSAMRHAGAWSWRLGPWGSGGSRYDFAKRVGMGLDASVVMAPVQWLQRNLPVAPIVVDRRDGKGERLPSHPLTALVDRPNFGYSGNVLLQATVFSLCIDGNGHWIKIRNGANKVIQLWYAPFWMMRPRWPQDGSQYISHYEYSPGGMPIDLPVEDVVHFRVGIDPRNTRLGLSPLRSVLREIWSDMEAAGFMASLLRNSGVPGLVLSPDGPQAARPEDVKDIKQYLRERFTGENRGEPLVMSAKTKVERVGFNPSELDLTAVSNRAEERVCALLGIPSVVVGFHAGSSQTSVGATMQEQRKLAWHNGVIPMQSVIAEELERSLLPDFEPRAPERLAVYFDTSEVEAMQDEADKLVVRAERLLRAGAITVAESRQMVGLESDDTHNIYLRPFGVIEVPGDTGRAPPEAGLMGSLPGGRKHSHTAFEERMARTAPHAEPSPELERYVLELEALTRRQARRFERRLAAFFRELGEAAAEAAGPILDDAFKNQALNLLVTERVIEAMAMPEKLRIFREHYERHFLETGRAVAGLGGMVGLGTDLPDRAGRAVIATGGRRAGLIDLSGQTRQRVLTTVAEQRALGAGAEAIARGIRDLVPAGPWSDSRVRAMVIARTETKYAQNVSVFEHARANGVERYMIFDARLGDTDEVCEALDGAIVTAAEAEQLLADEHPNGTRSITPYFG